MNSLPIVVLGEESAIHLKPLAVIQAHYLHIVIELLFFWRLSVKNNPHPSSEEKAEI